MEEGESKEIILTRYEQISDTIQANLEKLPTLDQKSEEAHKLAAETSDLLIRRQFMTIGQCKEVVN